MIVSVVITTKNEEKHIGNYLESIRSQSYPQEKIEIIGVDNNSHDNAKTIANQYTDKTYNFGLERSAQRNFGVSQANGKYVYYVDSDMRLMRCYFDVRGVKRCEGHFCSV